MKFSLFTFLFRSSPAARLPPGFLSLTSSSDTLLNVFLAIAVDNLANAQELTKVQWKIKTASEIMRRHTVADVKKQGVKCISLI